MAGLWDITWGDPDALDQERVNVSLVETELTGVALGVRTKAAALATIEASLGRSLTGTVGTLGTELGDLDQLADDFSQGATQSRLVLAHKSGFALNAAELNLIDEATFRSVLGITV